MEIVAYLLKHESGARLVDINIQSMQIAQQLHGGHIHKLITLDQHNRIMAEAKPDAELVALLRDTQEHVYAAAISSFGAASLLEKIVAKLAELQP